MLLPALLLAGLPAGCTAPTENSVHRAARERQLGELRWHHDDLERERQLLRAAIEQDEAAVVDLRGESAAAAQRRRLVLGELHAALALLAAAEQDLAAARTRTAAIEQELTPLRAKEEQVATSARLLADLETQRAALEPRLQAAAAELEAARARLQPQLDALAAQVRQLDALAAAVAAVQQALTPAAPAAATPAGVPEKPPGAQKQ